MVCQKHLPKNFTRFDDIYHNKRLSNCSMVIVDTLQQLLLFYLAVAILSKQCNMRRRADEGCALVFQFAFDLLFRFPD